MRKWYAPIFLAAAVVISAVAYPSLPERVPVHWGISGNVDRWGSRLEAVLIAPVLGVLLWGLMRALPRLDPRRENYARFQGTYDLVVNATITLLVVMHVCVLGAALGFPIQLSRVVPAAVGALVILLGNVLPRARPNWWFGIRTPWTLSNDRVWTRTHRVGGYLLVIAGIATLAAALLASGRVTHVVLVGAMFGAAVGSVVYSYFVWRQETSR